MKLLDWLRDGLLGDRARFKHLPEARSRSTVADELADPSGRHDFGRRAHHPDPNGHYGFEPDSRHRLSPVKPRE